MIEVEHLTKRFNGTTAVDAISIDVRPGEDFGFLGPNGAGKTTTINILCTLLNPTLGHARVAGFDVQTHPRQVRQSIGIIFQDPSLDERLTAWENLMFHAMIYRVPASVRRARIQNLLKMVRLADRRGDVVKTFSGGMKRRLEVARGLLHEPKVLFLDEPTIGLDPQTRNHIWAHILELKSALKVTVFLTTHYMDEAEHCDRIAIIDHGKIVACDTPAALKRQVGGDIVTIRTDDDLLAAQELGERYQVKPLQDERGLHFEIQNGQEFVPALFSTFRTRIQSVDVRRPSLDDVFLRLTGHDMRDESVSPVENLRRFKRIWRKATR